MADPLPKQCLILGAGLAGLLAGQRLQAQGWQVTILDKGRGVGGRMATRRIPTPAGTMAVLDHGAQFFTVRSDEFARLVAGWQAAGVVAEWSRGFAVGDGSWLNDGHPRYRGVGGMTAVAKHLAAGLDVHLACQVTAVVAQADRWLVHTADGQQYPAGALLLTPPVPQSLALLAAGGVALPEVTQAALAGLSYDPCLALLVVLEGPSGVPRPGGMWPGGEIIGWLADNTQKGISPEVHAVTIHATPEFSRTHYETAPEEVARLLLAEARPWLGSRVLMVQQQRWRYSIPRLTYPEPCLVVPGPPPLLFAGDIFAGPRVEGAALSGLAAAAALAAL